MWNVIKRTISKKMQKLLYKQTQEIKQLIASNLDDAEISDWTLVYPKGEQTSIHYFTQSSEREKIERLKLFDSSNKIRFCSNGVFMTDKKYNEASEDVKLFYNENFDNEEENYDYRF